MQTILVTGANGQLGNELRVLSESCHNIHFIFTDQAELDITDSEAVMHYVAQQPVDFIVNCAAYTAVDKAENDEDKCYQINALAVSYLAHAAQTVGAKMIHVSTDYVYSGTACTPYVETDPTDPTSVYGTTKLAGEQLMFQQLEQGIVLRTSWLYSSFGGNFVKTMMQLGATRERLTVIADQVGTPTYARDLAEAILHIVQHPTFVPGVYNYSNEGACSWYDFAVKIHELAGITTCQVEPIRTEQYPTPAQRPAYSLMDKQVIKSTYGITINHWEKSLRACMARL